MFFVDRQSLFTGGLYEVVFTGFIDGRNLSEVVFVGSWSLFRGGLTQVKLYKLWVSGLGLLLRRWFWFTTSLVDCEPVRIEGSATILTGNQVRHSTLICSFIHSINVV